MNREGIDIGHTVQLDVNSEDSIQTAIDKINNNCGRLDILVNSVCPGWIGTDMGGNQAPPSPEEGADTPVWLATLPDDGPSGGFFRERERIAW